MDWSPHEFGFFLRLDVEHMESELFRGDAGICERAAGRMLSFLAAADARATFAVTGATARRYPGIVRDLLAAGHGLIGHGMNHLALAELDEAGQVAELKEMRETLEALAGRPVRGTAPCRDSSDERSAGAMLDAGLDFTTYVSGAPRSPLPVSLAVPGRDRPLRVLTPHYRPRVCASDWSALRSGPPWNEPAWDAGLARARWGEMLDRAREAGGMVSLIVHPWLLEVNPGELEVVRDLLAAARATGGWIGTYPELAGRLAAGQNGD